MKMQTISTVVTWSAIAIAAFMAFTALTVGNSALAFLA